MSYKSDIAKFKARSSRYSGDKGPWLEHFIEDEGMIMCDALKQLHGWEMIPYIDEKRGHMATIAKKNREVHFAIYSKHRKRSQISIRRIMSFLQPILDENVFLVTKVDKDDDIRFIEHLGFQRLGSTLEGITTYILNEIKYPKARGRRCA